MTATSNGEVTFSEAMDSSTINGSTFTLVKQGTSQPVAAQVTYDPAAKKATLDPDADLDPSATYTATVKGGTSGVKDPAGNPLAQDTTWSFTTAAPPPADTTPPETTIDSGPSDTITVARLRSPSPPTRRVAPSSASWTRAPSLRVLPRRPTMDSATVPTPSR